MSWNRALGAVLGSPSRPSRQSRVLARWLRRTVIRAGERDPVRRRRLPLRCDRVAAVRAELLEIADLLDHGHDPDRALGALLRSLLTDGCDSPLYNDEIHISELRATLYHVRRQLRAPVLSRLDTPPREHARQGAGGLAKR